MTSANFTRIHGWGVRGLLLAASLLAGCQTPSNKPGSNSTASIQIKNASPEEIYASAERVFSNAGFNLTSSSGNALVFERPGSRTDALKYGGWGTGVTMRARVRVSPLGSQQLVQCDVFAVKDKGDSFFENENPVRRGYREEYQKLLESVQGQVYSRRNSTAP